MKRSIVMLVAPLVASCSLAPDYVRPAAPIPATWPQGEAYSPADSAASTRFGYREVFTDPRLQQLIALALDNNRDLRVAYANLAAARAQIRVIGARQLPDIEATGSASYRAQTGADAQNYALGGGISGFELDFFGKLANATEAERNSALATEAGARAVRLALIADLAAAWANYASDRDLKSIAEETAAVAQRSYDLTRLRLEGGIAPRSDLRQAEQVLALAQGDVASQTSQLAQDENLIRLLAGTITVDKSFLPSGVAEALDSIKRLPVALSSDVLLLRPDVIQAEYQLRAANADIGVARAQLFPSISLTGLLGLASGSLASLFGSDSFSATGVAGASVPIFDFGGRRAGVEVSEAQRDAAVANYERTIQTAFREMADALADEGTIDARIAAARRNTVAASDTADLVQLRYRAGVDSALAQLDAQRSLYAARLRENAALLQAMLSRIRLYRATGGDVD